MSHAPDNDDAGELDEALRDEIQTAYRTWLAASDLRPRNGQRQMIAHIARTISGVKQDDEGMRLPSTNSHVCVVEAGTGTGKTIGYMLGALPVTKARGLKLVITTATVALQEQLIYQDLPNLLDKAPLNFDFALAKGRGRYACPARLTQHVSGDTRTEAVLNLFEEIAIPQGEAPGTAAKADYNNMLKALNRGSWDGERETWESALEDRTWAGVTMDHRGCGGPKCDFFRSCPYFLAREQAQQADVIVANHDLVLADLALGGGVVLPNPAETVYVFDEGHHLATKALAHLRRSARILQGITNIEGVQRLLGTLAQRKGRDVPLVEAAQHAALINEPLCTNLRSAQEIAEALPGLNEQAPGRSGQQQMHRFPRGEPGPELREVATELAQGHAELTATIEKVIDHLSEPPEGAEGESQETNAWLIMLSQQLKHLEDAAALWADFAEDSGEVPHARWIARPTQAHADTSLDLEFQASPLQAADSLKEVLWERCFAAIVTSATLSTTSGFKRFDECTGIPPASNHAPMPSSFPYAERAVLAVPAMRNAPGNVDAHTAELVELLPQLIDLNEATLVIFTSRSQLRRVTAALPPSFLARVLSQLKITKHDILSGHRARVDAGEGSVIFGLASFAEGVDLPGDYCRHVIITKLPFAPPGDPVEQELEEWLKSQGRNHFQEVSIPDAALRLKQACGRLMRSEMDSGRVTLLDSRIISQRYGRAIIDVLPPFRQLFGCPVTCGSGTLSASGASNTSSSP